ncbi:hypothetical protein NMY22_g18539 [Coprinellus aureogranulatus]|nr:hypothetical protein NMY22_g18539 [Coprinellus aureogranulatus]
MKFLSWGCRIGWLWRSSNAFLNGVGWSPPSPLVGWLAKDQQVVNGSPDATDHWQWLIRSHAEDQEAMLAFLRCVESDATLTPEHMNCMYSLLRQNVFDYYYSTYKDTGALPGLQVASDIQHDIDNQHSAFKVPSAYFDHLSQGFARDLTLSLCLHYVGFSFPPLLPMLFNRRLELILRVLNSSSDFMELAFATALVSDFRMAYHEDYRPRNLPAPNVPQGESTVAYRRWSCYVRSELTSSLLEFHQQIEETVWHAMEELNQYPSMVANLLGIMCLVSPESGIPLSGRLHRWLSSLKPEDHKELSETIATGNLFINVCRNRHPDFQSLLDNKIFADLYRTIEEERKGQKREQSRGRRGAGEEGEREERTGEEEAGEDDAEEREAEQGGVGLERGRERPG